MPDIFRLSSIQALAIITILLMPSGSMAAAWTLAEGQTQQIITWRSYATGSFFDGDGEEREKNGRYTKNELQHYLEYGLGEDITLGASLFAGRQVDIQRFDVFTPGFAERQEVTRTIELEGLNRADMFARYQLYKGEDVAIAVQPLVSFPPYFINDVPEDVVQDEMAYEAGLAGGYNFPLFGQMHYAELTTAYRHRDGVLGDQFSVTATAGLTLNEQWVLMPELQHTGAVGGINYAATTITGQNDYDLTKGQLSLLYRFNEQLGVQAGAFSHLSGRNTGAGGGGLIALWIKL